MTRVPIVAVIHARDLMASLSEEIDRFFGSIALAACAASNDNKAISFTDLSVRAVEILDVMSEVLVECRRSPAMPWTPPPFTSPLDGSWDPQEITDYLLAPDGSHLRLDELRERLRSLVRSVALLRRPVGRA